MVKKGEFPARPPTLAEAMEDAKVFDNSKDEVAAVPKKEIKRPTVKQIDAHLNEPLPADAPPIIDSNWVTPDKSEAVINLQMDYILQRKSLLIRSILGSRFFSSLVIGILAMVTYKRLNGYISDYLLRDGYISAIFELFKNSYFVDDLVNVSFTFIFIFAACFIFVKYQTAWFQTESEEVVDKMEDYFNGDLKKYSTIKNFQKPKKDEKELINFFKTNSVVIDYRNAPIAFLITKPIKDEENSFEITSYGIRRVYVKAEMFRDLLGLTLKKFVDSKKDFKVMIKIYSFETLDVKLLTKAGFVKTNSEKFSFILSNFLNMTYDTYEFELNSVEF